MNEKVLLMIPTLSGGGAEKNILYLYDYLIKQKFDVTLLVFNLEGEFKNEVEGRKYEALQKKGKVALPSVIRFLYKNKFDTVISTIAIANLYAGILKVIFPKINFICREANILSVENHGFIFNSLYRYFINKVNHIVAQSNDMADDLKNNFSVHSEKITVINNPIDIKLVNTPINFISSVRKERVKLLSIGRLSKQKGYLEFLTLLSKGIDVDFEYKIIGSGPLEYEIKLLIDDLNLQDKVKLLGFQDEPYKFMTQSDFVVLPSLHEGFPNVLLESCVCGTPVIANDCPGGINEIIQDNVNGMIFSLEIGDFNSVLNRALLVNWNNKEISQAAIKKYSLDSTLNKYLALISNKYSR